MAQSEGTFQLMTLERHTYSVKELDTLAAEF